MRWLEPEWRDDADTWIRQRVRVTGAIEQPHVYPWATAMRVPTAAGDLWFPLGYRLEEAVPTETYLQDAPWSAPPPRS